MKFKDYKRFGKISVNSRKKSSKNTIRGLVFSLLLIVPVAFLVIAFYGDFTAQLNNERTISSFNIKTNGFTDDSDTKIINNSTYFSSELIDDFMSLDDIEDYIVSEKINVLSNNEKYAKFLIGDIEYEQTIDNSSFNSNRESFTNIKIIDLDRTSSIFTKAEEDYFKSNNLGEIFTGNTFSDDSKGQIMLSQDIIDKYSLPNDIIGKEISLTYTNDGSAYNYMYIDNDNNPYNDFDRDSGSGFDFRNSVIFHEFTVVGIISSELYNCPSRGSSLEHIWVTTDSLYHEDEVLAPVLTNHEETSGDYTNYITVATYVTDFNELQKTASDNKVLFIPYGYAINKVEYCDTLALTHIQFKDFSAANAASKRVTALLTAINPELSSYYISDNFNDIFNEFSMYDNIISVVAIVFGIFGGVILLATLLNLYNTINYSVESRKNYLGVLKAIGIQNKDINLLYFVEIMIILVRTFIWTVILAGGVSFGITLLVNMGLEYVQELLPFTLAIDFFTYFPLTLLCLFGIQLVIALVFSFSSCRAVTKKPILEILLNDK